jgi:nucleotide-binding universal stress UspA family protein
MKILLAVDGSAYTKRMLAYLSTHEEMFGTQHEYHALFVPLSMPPRVVNMVGSELVNDSYQQAADKVFAPVTKFMARHKINLKTQFKPGSPGRLIAKVAQDGKFDLLVMGSHGDGALMGLVMGSVASTVLAKCSVPVLIIR